MAAPLLLSVAGRFDAADKEEAYEMTIRAIDRRNLGPHRLSCAFVVTAKPGLNLRLFFFLPTADFRKDFDR